jgi:cbb3-type cytochrome oxidase subunit 3
MDVNEETAAAALGLLFFSVGALAAGFYLYKKQKAKAANEKLQPLQENEKGVMT